MAAKIELKHVTYAYGRGTPFEVVALDNVDLEIHPGLVTGIIGHTGSGKSTLVRLFNGLEKPESGNVLLDGKDIWENPKEIGKVRFRVGLVMQYPEYQLFEETVAKDVAFGPKNLGLSQEEIDERVREAIELVGLDFETIKDRSPFDLSGGQKRRVAIAGVVAMRPEVLILDEPTAGLDPKAHKDVLAMVEEVHRRTGNITILVSHNMADIARLCDKIIVIDSGKLVTTGTPYEVFSKKDELRAVGLELPPVTKFTESLRERGLQLESTILDIDQAADQIAAYLKRKAK